MKSLFTALSYAVIIIGMYFVITSGWLFKKDDYDPIYELEEKIDKLSDEIDSLHYEISYGR